VGVNGCAALEPKTRPPSRRVTSLCSQFDLGLGSGTSHSGDVVAPEPGLGRADLFLALEERDPEALSLVAAEQHCGGGWRLRLGET
jgi:hypothetical protein